MTECRMGFKCKHTGNFLLGNAGPTGEYPPLLSDSTALGSWDSLPLSLVINKVLRKFWLSKNLLMLIPISFGFQ